jgi:hypothetical protein
VPPPGHGKSSAAAYGAAAVAGAADVNCTLWRNGSRAAPPVALNKARLRARQHGGALSTVQQALDEAAAEGRGPREGLSGILPSSAAKLRAMLAWLRPGR